MGREMDKNRSLARLFDSSAPQKNGLTYQDEIELAAFREQLKNEIHKNMLSLVDFGIEHRILCDKSLLVVKKIIELTYSEDGEQILIKIDSDHELELRSLLSQKDSHVEKNIFSGYVYCLLFISAASVLTRKLDFRSYMRSSLEFYHYYLKSYGSLLAKINNSIARAKSQDSLDKKHRKNRVAKEMIFQLWEQGNSATGRAWCTYSDCAKYAIEHLGFEYEKNTIERWLSRQYSPKKQIAINKKLD